jgi:hypothetical protein
MATLECISILSLLILTTNLMGFRILGWQIIQLKEEIKKLKK